ncbi:hypothetical protein CSB63_1334 [Streptococcus thermophilus]|nr:hypothetical protein CSB63_1334 [Streptococcus thermophilus]
MARFRRTIVKIMSRTLELFLGNEPNYGGGLALQETYTVLKKIYYVPD